MIIPKDKLSILSGHGKTPPIYKWKSKAHWSTSFIAFKALLVRNHL